jgi:hypothetical protein
MDFCGSNRPYFEPHNLGAKCPTFDFLVELIGTPHPLYFLAQVKTTTKGSGKQSSRLPIEVSEEDVRRMSRCPIPTYLMGVDEPSELVYIAGIRGDTEGAITSMQKKYPLNPKTLKLLWEEVSEFWDRVGHTGLKTSAFTI